jgi:signal transduction histidine kinase
VLARTLAEVEDAHGVTIEAVTVGDAPLDDRLQALLRAVREAAVNAAKHGAGSAISVYAEVENGRAEVFVRDRGPGFDPATVPEDRLGVRQSILGRMERHGGRATIRSEPGEGTEVHVEMALTAAGGGS